jgi:hypothetical protein
MGETCGTCAGEDKLIQILVEKPKGKRPFERPRHTCEDNTEINPKDIKCDGVDWIYLAGRGRFL